MFKENFANRSSAGIQSAVFNLSNLVIQAAINSLGTVVIAASSAAFNIEILV